MKCRLQNHLGIVALVVLVSWSLWVQSAAGKSAAIGQGGAAKGRIILDLGGHQWQVERMRPGQGVKEGLGQLPSDAVGDTYTWNGAEVPGDVYTDAWRAGEIDDPHYGRNLMKAKWVMDYEWWYNRQFTVPQQMRGKVIRLVFEGVDYACDVWLNGTYLGRHEGMFSPFAFDITDIVSFSKKWKGGNKLMVKLDPPPKVYSKVAGRKFPWHGDYWRSVVTFGIWRPVKVVATGPVRIEDVYVEPDVKDNGSAELNIQVELENHTKTSREVIVNAKVAGKNFRSKTYTASVVSEVKPGRQTVQMKLPVDDAKLWWPWDLGKQNLYLAKVTVEENGELHDRSETTFGIREVKMEMNPGFTKDEVEYPWTVMINGKRHFMRSACWGGPPDIFYGRNTLEKYRKLIKLAKEANLNNLRIFGWHPPEIPEFYELCNEAGITVWEDVLPIASLTLPDDDEFRDATFKEAIAAVKERRNHPCLVLLQGSEELFHSAADPAFNKKFMFALEDAIRPYTNLHFIPSSPLSTTDGIRVGFKPKENVHANNMFYMEGELPMEKYFPSLDYAAIAEVAISSVPCVESLKKFIPPDELWPPGPSWGHHWADLDTLRTLNFEVFGDERTGSLEEFVTATQITQGTIFQFCAEHFRRRKPRTSAVALCHFMTYSPDMKWGIVDHYQVPKISHEFVKRAYQPLLVSLQYPKRRWASGEKFNAKIWVVNDYYESFRNCTVELRITDNQKKLLKEKSFKIGDIGPDSSKEYADVKWNVTGKIGDSFKVELSLLDSRGSRISANHYTLLVADEEKDLQKYRQIGQKSRQRRYRFNRNCNRYFPALTGEDGKKQTGATIPTAKGF